MSRHTYTASAISTVEQRPRPGKHWRKLVRRNPIGFFSVLFLSLLALMAVAAPLIAPYDPTQGSLLKRLLPPLSPGHILGTDALGRDMLSRLLYGARVSLLIALSTVLVSAVIGTVIGAFSGFRRGIIDRVLMRLIDVQLSFPFIVLALTVAAILGPSLRNIIITLVISSWVYYARLARAETLKLTQKQFVEAASASGAKAHWIFLRHLIPNLVPTTIVMASLEVGRIIVAEAGISFLGYGVQPPLAAWGNMISEGRHYIFSAWWLTVLPGAVISLAVLAANLSGDWVRDVLDPQK